MVERTAYALRSYAVSAPQAVTATRFDATPAMLQLGYVAAASAVTPADEKNGLGGGFSFDLTRSGENGVSLTENLSTTDNPAKPRVAAGLSSVAASEHERAAVLCAVSVRARSEAAMARRVMRAAEGAALDAYALRREMLRREDGAWRLRQDVLFPGYVIVETCDPELLAKRLEVLSASSHLVHGAGNSVGTLTEREAALVRTLGGRDHLVGVSVGEIVSNRLNVTSGPLVGLERLVAKIDRHKRIAYLDAAAFASFAAGEPRRPGRRGGVAAARAEAPRPVRVALEVVRKE